MRPPTLFDATPSPHRQATCPECRQGVDLALYYRKGLRVNWKCPECRVPAAGELLWLMVRTWCRSNWRLLRMAINSVRADLLVLADSEDVVSISLPTVLKSAITFDPTITEWTTWVVGGLKLAVLHEPNGVPAVNGIEWDRVEAVRKDDVEECELEAA